MSENIKDIIAGVIYVGGTLLLGYGIISEDFRAMLIAVIMYAINFILIDE